MTSERVQAVYGGTFDDLPDTHSRTIPVHSPRENPLDGRAGHTGSGNSEEEAAPPAPLVTPKG